MSKKFKHIIGVMILGSLSAMLLVGCGAKDEAETIIGNDDGIIEEDFYSEFGEENDDSANSEFDHEFVEDGGADENDTTVVTVTEMDENGNPVEADDNPVIDEFIIPNGYVKKEGEMGDISSYVKETPDYESTIMLSRASGRMDLSYVNEGPTTFDEQQELNKEYLNTFYGLYNIYDKEMQDEIVAGLENVMSNIDLKSPIDIQETTIELPELTFKMGAATTISDDANKNLYGVDFMTINIGEE